MTMSERKKIKHNDKSLGRFFVENVPSKTRFKIPATTSSESTGTGVSSLYSEVSDSAQSNAGKDNDGKNSLKKNKRFSSKYILFNKKVKGEILTTEPDEETDEKEEAKSQQKDLAPPVPIAHKSKQTPAHGNLPTSVPSHLVHSKGHGHAETSHPPLTVVPTPGQYHLEKQALEDKLATLPELPRRKTGVRTFRLWRPKNKSISVKVGNAEEEEDVFALDHIKAQTFEEFRKEAKLLLPSAAGGNALDNVEDFLHAAPSLKKEADPKNVHNTLKRLSIGKDEDENQDQDQEYVRKKSRKSVDYGAARVIPREQGSISNTIVSVESEEEEEEEREAEEAEERRQAGVDIKGKLKALKELAEHLVFKRPLRHQLVEKATGHTLLDVEEVPIRENLLFLAEYAHDYVIDLFANWNFWERTILEVNGRYGAIVASYFMWLKRIVVLNVLSTIAAFLIIVIPQMFEDLLEEETNTTSSTNTSSINITRVSFTGPELITGEGALHHSYLYYSGYRSRNDISRNFLANPAFRFLITIGIVFLINTYFIFSRISAFYQGVRLESKVVGFVHNVHFTSIMCGWDFSCGNPIAAEILRKSIQRELHILANVKSQAEQRALKIKEDEKRRFLAFLIRKLGLKWGSIAMHILSNGLLLICCFLQGISLFYLCKVKLDYYIHCISETDKGDKRALEDLDWWACPNGSRYLEVYIMTLPALFSSITTLTLNMIIVFVGDLESWETTETRVYATMIRAGLFYGSNLQVFYFFWIIRDVVLKEEGFAAETIFGKEMYRLVVIKGILDVTINLLVKQLNDMIRKNSPNYKRTAFRTEYCAMQMFFLHTVGGISTLHSPGLSLLITLRLILDFYQYRYSLFSLSSNENYVSHASPMYGPYLVTFFISFLILIFMNIYYLSETTPSTVSGPFINYKRYHQALSIPLDRKETTRWIKYLLEPGFLVTLLAILVALLYFCWKWAKAYEPIIEQLNDEIFLDRADRDILLRAIFEVAKATNTGPQSIAFKLGIEQAPGSVSTTDLPIQESRTQISEPEHKHEHTGRDHVKNLWNQVHNTPFEKLQKLGRDGVPVDIWNVMRHRKEAMHRAIKRIIGAKRNIRTGSLRVGLNYDPTSRIFDQEYSPGSSSSSDEFHKKKKKKNVVEDALLQIKSKHIVEKRYSIMDTLFGESG